MSNPSARRGADFELLLTKGLAPIFGPQVERGRAGATDDKGDIKGIAGLCLEAKGYVKGTVASAITDGLRDLDIEQVNAGAHYGFVIVKRPRSRRFEDQLLVVNLGSLGDGRGLDLMRLAHRDSLERMLK